MARRRAGARLVIGRSLCFAIALGAVLTGPAQAQEYIRSEIRLNMRTGPGVEFKILKTLTSGDSVTRLESQGNWVKIRTPEGREGWLPAGYTTTEIPARVALEEAQDRLAQAEERFEQLDRDLKQQAEQLGEIQELRRHNLVLEEQIVNMRSSFSNWRWMVAGAGLLALGLLAGRLIGRRISSRNRNRLKL